MAGPCGEGGARLAPLFDHNVSIHCQIWHSFVLLFSIRCQTVLTRPPPRNSLPHRVLPAFPPAFSQCQDECLPSLPNPPTLPSYPSPTASKRAWVRASARSQALLLALRGSGGNHSPRRGSTEELSYPKRNKLRQQLLVIVAWVSPGPPLTPLKVLASSEKADAGCTHENYTPIHSHGVTGIHLYPAVITVASVGRRRGGATFRSGLGEADENGYCKLQQVYGMLHNKISIRGFLWGSCVLM